MTPASSSVEGQSTTDSRTMALAMFEGQVPCSLQFFDPPCPKNAAWLAHFDHEENTVADCPGLDSMLLCVEHKQVIATAHHPFWRLWHNTPAVLCDHCGTPLRIGTIEAIR
jgi:hypothetical protein